MVNSGGQLYTIEGVAAGLILLITAYFVVNSTSIYTPGDTHISDMQLEVTGADALAMMDTAPNATVAKSPLREIVEQDDSARFATLFREIVNAKSGAARDDIQFRANVTYVRSDSSITSIPLAESSRLFTGTEHAVHISRWVLADRAFPDAATGRHAALVEVLLWRD